MTYGTDVLNFINLEDEDRSDPMMEVFPRVTKCTFHKYGSSGTIQKHDALCVLGLNIINEKIYITLWFWFVLLAVLTALYTVYIVAIISMPGLRRNLITPKSSKMINSRMKIKIRSRVCIQADCPWWLLGSDCESIRLRRCSS